MPVDANDERKRRRLCRIRERRQVLLLFALGIIVVIILSAALIWTFIRYYSADRLYDDTAGKYVITNDSLPVTGDRAKHDEAQAAAEVNWWELADVRLEELSLKYPDVIGWLYFENEDISYPIVWSGDNEKYLRRAYTGRGTSAGSIFLDGDSSPDLSDQHSIIYGHNMRDDTMFGRLAFYKEKEGYYDDHRYFQIFTGDRVRRYEIFAYAYVPVSHKVFEIYGDKTEDFWNMIIALESDSYQKTDVKLNDRDSVVTLSTCDGNDSTRFIVSAVLVDEHGVSEYIAWNYLTRIKQSTKQIQTVDYMH